MRIHHVLLAIATCAPLVLGAQQKRGAVETGFLWRLGTDTLHIERVTRSGTRLSGTHLTRVPETILREWSAELGPDGSVQRFEQTVRKGSGEVLSSRTLAFARDSVTNTFRQGDSTSSSKLAAPTGSLPDIPNSYGLLELALQRLAGHDSISFSVLSLGGQPAEASALARAGSAGSDTIRLHLRDLPTINLRVDREGRIVWANNLGTIVERIPAPDMTHWAGVFATRPLGALSPRDTVRAVVGGATVLVDYSRPARRGRVVFGGMVPWNAVWRTGANRTTTLVSDRELQVGDATLPAGSYALFTIPTPTGWTLIVNRSVGAGTDYDAGQDVARIAMRTERVPQSVERFTIGLEPRGAEALLSFSWEQTRAAVTVRQK
ncbi:MAG TPA: DUF2911 domain-containing protein [Gemmatimonadales bacterium]|nr:DUF2911 domain-containing protein [Gemmatimonadales bacterium]